MLYTNSVVGLLLSVYGVLWYSVVERGGAYRWTWLSIGQKEMYIKTQNN